MEKYSICQYTTQSSSLYSSSFPGEGDYKQIFFPPSNLEMSMKVVLYSVGFLEVTLMSCESSDSVWKQQKKWDKLMYERSLCHQGSSWFCIPKSWSYMTSSVTEETLQRGTMSEQRQPFAKWLWTSKPVVTTTKADISVVVPGNVENLVSHCTLMQNDVRFSPSLERKIHMTNLSSLL